MILFVKSCKNLHIKSAATSSKLLVLLQQRAQIPFLFLRLPKFWFCLKRLIGLRFDWDVMCVIGSLVSKGISVHYLVLGLFFLESLSKIFQQMIIAFCSVVIFPLTFVPSSCIWVELSNPLGISWVALHGCGSSKWNKNAAVCLLWLQKLLLHFSFFLLLSVKPDFLP